jgi:hypothetical protein
VLLYNSRLKLFVGKLKYKRKGPFIVEEAYKSGAVRLKGSKDAPCIFNGQRLKHYLDMVYQWNFFCQPLLLMIIFSISSFFLERTDSSKD